MSSAQIPVAAPPAVVNSQPDQPTSSLFNGPTIAPRGQVDDPFGTKALENGARQSHTNGNSPAPNQSLTTDRPNGFPTSSPPQYRSPQPPTTPYANVNSTFNTNGSPHPFPSTHNLPYGSSFNRPASSAGPVPSFPSPVKRSPVPSPKPTNGLPTSYNFTNSPHSSFPPSSAQRLSFSPTKHSSPPPANPYLSSPALAHARLAYSPAQHSSPRLPDPVPAPEKHDGARPVSSHKFSETTILPPMNLAPDQREQNLSPPVKKTSPTPDRPRFAPVGENGYGGGF